MSVSGDQMEVCSKFGADYVATSINLKLGVAENVRGDLQPVNGMRHLPGEGTTGWFIYAGEEMSSEASFFKPLHVKHLDEWRLGLTQYLGLAPGWRFLVADGYEDVWFDPKLLVDGED